MAYSKQENDFRFKQLKIWQNSLLLVPKVYLLTKNLPKDELFALVSQIRRAVVSIPTNIAEGSGSSSKKDFGNFLNIAIRSGFEVSSLLNTCISLKYLSSGEVSFIESELTIIIKQITAFKNTLINHEP